MKLLIITQSVDKNDENLGAFYYWWERMAKDHELTIIAGRIGTVDLPKHVQLYSFGKDKGYNKLQRIWKFWELFSRHYARCDAVLFHQIPEFVIAATPFIWTLRKPKILWYAHGAAPRSLVIAERLVDDVVTSSREGFRLPSKKAHYVGQAINTDVFRPPPENLLELRDNHEVRLITVGRTSPVKNYHILLEACARGKRQWTFPWSLAVVGGPLRPGDDTYLAELKQQTLRNGLSDLVSFRGASSYSDIPRMLQEHDMFINLSQTGSLDKAVFEAMATGLTVLTSNEAYRRMLPEPYVLHSLDPAYIAERIAALARDRRPNMDLRKIVVVHHSIDRTIERILGLVRPTA